jgi:hypothetical protein
MASSARAKALRALVAALLLAGAPGCAIWSSPVNPALGAAARRDGPIAVSDALEALIEAGQDSPADRDFAYEAVRWNREDTPDATFGRAAVTGRLVQQQALRGAHLVREVERDALRSRELDPEFRDGAATRLLGTLYVAAPATFLAHGDSERGLELLEELVAKRPDRLDNHLRLAEAYLALGDPAPANASLCRCSSGREALRRDERLLLDRMLQQAEPLRCPAPAADVDVAAPGD